MKTPFTWCYVIRTSWSYVIRTSWCYVIGTSLHLMLRHRNCAPTWCYVMNTSWRYVIETFPSLDATSYELHTYHKNFLLFLREAKKPRYRRDVVGGRCKLRQTPMQRRDVALGEASLQLRRFLAALAKGVSHSRRFCLNTQHTYTNSVQCWTKFSAANA